VRSISSTSSPPRSSRRFIAGDAHREKIFTRNVASRVFIFGMHDEPMVGDDTDA
jgi:hypothetical protein